MPGREAAAVFFFDVLGFSARIRRDAATAIDALSDLAAILSAGEVFANTGRWEHRYALSDSVFLTHREPSTALRLAGDLVFNLTTLNTTSPLSPAPLCEPLAVGMNHACEPKVLRPDLGLAPKAQGSKEVGEDG